MADKDPVERTQAELLVTAAHEAGHAVFAAGFGIALQHASIVPDEKSWGRVQPSDDAPSWEEGERSGRKLWKARGYALVELAGIQAARMMQDHLGLPCPYCGDAGCKGFDRGWLVRCVERRRQRCCSCDEPRCLVCNPWPISAHPTLGEAKEMLSEEQFETWYPSRFEECVELMETEVVLSGMDRVKDELMRKRFLTRGELDRIIQLERRFVVCRPEGELSHLDDDDEDEYSDDDAYIDYLAAHIDELGLED